MNRIQSQIDVIPYAGILNTCKPWNLSTQQGKTVNSTLSEFFQPRQNYILNFCAKQQLAITLED